MKKKINNKGFMMAEVVVVAAIVLGVLTGIYTSYNRVFAKYIEILDYYNIDGIYTLASFRDELIKSDDNNNRINDLNDALITSFNNGCSRLGNNYGKAFICTKSGLNDLINNPSSFGLNIAYKEYLSYLKDAVSFNNNYIMIYEYTKDNNSNYYSYLELEA